MIPHPPKTSKHEFPSFARLMRKLGETFIVCDVMVQRAQIEYVDPENEKGDGLSLFGFGSSDEQKWHLKNVVGYKNGYVDLSYSRQSIGSC